MSAKELDRVEVVRRLLRQEIRQVQAAALLGLRGKVLNAAVLPARPTKVKDLPWVLAKTAVAVPVPAA